MTAFEEKETEGIPFDKKKLLEDSTLTVRIDCTKCTAKSPGCHSRCPQLKAVESDSGKTVAGELLCKGRRARIHKDVNVTFGKFMALMGETETEV